MRNDKASSIRGRPPSTTRPRAPTGVLRRSTTSSARSTTISSRRSGSGITADRHTISRGCPRAGVASRAAGKMNASMETVTAFAPATVSNVACGFDVLGFALFEPGDTVTVTFSSGRGVQIDDIAGDAGRLPRDAAKNTAGIAAQALLDRIGERRGVALRIRKGPPLSSG